MDLRRDLPDDIEVNVGLRTFALPFTGDHEHMELATM